MTLRGHGLGMGGLVVVLKAGLPCCTARGGGASVKLADVAVGGLTQLRPENKHACYAHNELKAA